MEVPCDVGIVFVDIVGSTRLYERLGDQLALSVVSETLDAMSQSVAEHGGKVVKTIGDEVMAAFADPASTLAAAVDMRRRLADLPPLPGPDATARIQVRIGLHFGPAMQEDGDYFGDTVNIAARMVTLANPDQILTTGDLLDLLPPELQAQATEFAEIEIKGRAGPVRIAQVTEGAQQETTQIRFIKSAEPPIADARLTLTIHGKQWEVPAGTKRVVCGRDPSCDVVLVGGQVSRQHATIEFRRGKVVLIDHSSNGTTLVVREERPVRLLREEFGMFHGGHIILGRLNEQGAVVIGFAIS